MMLKLASGQLVKAEQDDCGCAGGAAHPDMPHWLHHDMIWREMNKVYLVQKNGLGFAYAEIARLKEKEYQMINHGVIEIMVNL